MSVDPTRLEQRLVDAFRNADRVEPSEDLWTRVLHSIEEDRAHRRRIAWTTAVCLGVAGILVAVSFAFRRNDLVGVSIDAVVFEVLVTLALATLACALGPAIRRFGRNYTDDLWPSRPVMARSIIRLLDLAYFLVLAGYIAVTTRINATPTPRTVVLREHLAEQLGAASIRIGGLLLVIGVLHACTMVALPFVALIDNATRRRRPLPRWLTVVGWILLAWIATQLLGLALLAVIGIAES